MNRLQLFFLSAVVLGAVPGTLAAQTKSEDRVYFARDEELNRLIEDLKEAGTGSRYGTFFDLFEKALGILAEKGVLFADAGGGVEPAETALLVLLSGVPREAAQAETRRRMLNPSRILPGLDSASRSSAGDWPAPAEAAEAAACAAMRSGEFLEALGWFSLRRRLSPPPSEESVLREAMCLSKAGLPDRAAALLDVKGFAKLGRTAARLKEVLGQRTGHPLIRPARSVPREWSRMPGVPARGADLPFRAPELDGRGYADFPIPEAAFIDGRLFVADDASVFCMLPGSGGIAWQFPEFPPEQRRGDPSWRKPGFCLWGGILLVSQGRRILAFDSTSGKLLWRLGRKGGPASWPEDAEPGGPMKEACAFSTCVVSGGLAWSAFVRDKGGLELSLIGITEKGAIASRVFLCSLRPFSEFSRPPLPMLASSGGVLYVQTDMGAAFAFDPGRGRVIWATEYERAGPASRDLLARLGCATASAPVVAGPVAVFSPSDSSFSIALNAATGAEEWSIDREEAIVQAGRYEDELVFAGRDARFVEASTGRVIQTSPLPGFASGPGLRCPEGMVIPAGGAAVLAPRDGSVPATVLRPGPRLPFRLHAADGDAAAVFGYKVVFLGSRAESMAEAESDATDALRAAEIFESLGDDGKAIETLSGRSPVRRIRGLDRVEANAGLSRVHSRRMEEAEAAGDADGIVREAAAIEGLAPGRNPRAMLHLARNAFARGYAGEGLGMCLRATAVHPGMKPVEFGGLATVRIAAAELLEEHASSARGRAGIELAVEGIARGPDASMQRGWLDAAAEILPMSSAFSNLLAGLGAANIRQGRASEGLALLSRAALSSRGGGAAEAASAIAAQGRASGMRGFSAFWNGIAAASFLGGMRPAAVRGSCPGAVLSGFRPLPEYCNFLRPPLVFIWNHEGVPEEDPPSPLRVEGMGRSAGVAEFLGTPNTIWRLDAATGAADWIGFTGTRRSGTAFAAGRIVFVLADRISALDEATGGLAWERLIGGTAAGGEADVFPAAGGIAAVLPHAGQGMEVVFLEPEGGRLLRRWEATGAPPFSHFFPAERGLFEVWTSDGRRYVFDPGAGSAMERKPLAEVLGTAPGEAEILSASGGRVLGVFRTSGPGGTRLFAEDGAGGVAWSKEAQGLISAAGDAAGTVAAFRGSSWDSVEIRLISASKGETVWDRVLQGCTSARLWLHPAGIVFAHAFEGADSRLTAISAADGAVLWEKRMGEGIELSFSHFCVSVAGVGAVEILDAATGEGLWGVGGKIHPARTAHFLPWGLLAVDHGGGVCVYGAADRRGAGAPARHAGAGRLRGTVRASALFAAGMLRQGARALAGAISRDERVRFDQWSGALMNLRGLVESACADSPLELGVFRMDSAPDINGLLDEEWPVGAGVEFEVPMHLGFVRGWRGSRPAWDGPHDLGARLLTSWDRDNFYVALEIRDQIRMESDGGPGKPLNGDLVFYAFDPAGDGGSSMGYDDIVLITAAWKKNTAPFPEGESKEFKRKDHQSRPSDDGTRLVCEDAIPWSYINDRLRDRGLSAHAIRPRPGASFGFNVVVVDDDGEGAKCFLALAPGIMLGRGDRAGALDSYGPMSLMYRRFTPALFAKVVLR